MRWRCWFVGNVCVCVCVGGGYVSYYVYGITSSRLTPCLIKDEVDELWTGSCIGNF